MRIVLIKTDPKLGQIGDVKEVADGYARNYLFPNKIAKLATEGEIAKAQAMRKKQEIKKKKVKIDQTGLAEKLTGYKLEITSKADENGTFFAGITADKIAEKLTEAGFTVKSKQIKLDEPIKKVGNYNININIDKARVTQIDLEAKAE